MSSRRLALLGAAPIGPWVFTANVPFPRVRVQGLRDSLLRVGSLNPDTAGVIEADGTHRVEPAHWMQMTCDPPQKSVIVEIVSGAA